MRGPRPQSPHSMCSTAKHYLQVFSCILKANYISRLTNAKIINIYPITILRRCVDISGLFSCRKQKKYTKMWPNNRHERKSSYLCVAPAPRLHSQPPPSVPASALPLLGPAPLCAFIRPPAATARPAPGERGAPVTWSAPGLSWERGSHDELQPCTRAAAGAGRPRGVWRRGPSSPCLGRAPQSDGRRALHAAGPPGYLTLGTSSCIRRID